MNQTQKVQVAAIAAHEGAPGHHFHIAQQQELTGIPKFRKFGGYGAYIEGWGLYSERLANEMGLYKTPYDRFGMLSLQVWRAIRSEEHTSELQSLMRISYAVFCSKQTSRSQTEKHKSTTRLTRASTPTKEL